jgi:hypothetical protein
VAERTDSRPLDDPLPQVIHFPTPFERTNQEQDPDVSFEDGAIKVNNADGSTTIDFNPDRKEVDPGGDFNRNLAFEMDEGELSTIATEILDGIDRDEQSRKEWLDTRALGITLLGLKLEKPRTDAGTSSAPLEGMAVVRHPLLLEATVSFQATARAELLPAAGPVKVRNDSPMPPANINQDTSATQQLAESLQSVDELGQALEKDMNHYLTSTATEFVPDTDRMLFYVGFGGDGFKKVFNCPLRRRPVSESVDAEDLIVSNAATDLRNCGRVTHRIKMRRATLKRMQIAGAYRDVELPMPQRGAPTVVDKKKEDLSGHRQNYQRPEDTDYTVYEVYCECDIEKFAPKKFKGKELPLPYRVTIEKDSRKILDIRRNWDEDDEEANAKQYFVQFPLIRGLGFYGLGYIHLLGNTTNALTASWRLMLDAGMFGNFPGFLYAKGLGRQNTNTFRVAPGTGVGIDVGAQASIKDAIMPLPYKEPGAGFSQFISHIEEDGRRLGSTANIQVGEGKQDAPVGTTLALIEQASKVMDSAHKRLHAAQAEEFKLLKERFREDPEAFWRYNKRPTVQWKKDQFIQALNNCELVPVADPNNPTSLHRAAKAQIIKTLQGLNPNLYDATAVDMRVFRIADIDPQGLFAPTPAPQPPDPRMEAIQQKAQSEQAKIQDSAADRQSKEKIAQMNLNKEMIIHAHDMQISGQQAAQEMAVDRAKAGQDMQVDALQAQHELRGGLIKSATEMAMERQNHEAAMRRDQQEWELARQRETHEHQLKLSREAEAHEMKTQHAKELHEAKLQAAKQLASIKKPAKKD